MLAIRIDRDSVHPGDDLDPHGKTINAEPGISLGGLLMQIRRSEYLPGIAGGEATWIVKSSASSRPLGVIAQQWSEPELLAPLETPLQEHFGASVPSLHFTYWCQANPRLVLAAIRDGKALPSRF